eukprot:TRINITY_DN3177_c0_g1_i1.p1 TRINITY_DN3177_c0_g1~~TRINITY_DN3177_c0_g1_i1.p1  ORF type:complete len:657 (-),score=209.18 TRINITY_DN3177_c0_g1_i1:29-1999(-)
MSTKRLTTLKQLSRAVREDDTIPKKTWLLPIPEPKFSNSKKVESKNSTSDKRASLFDSVISSSKKRKIQSPFKTPKTQTHLQTESIKSFSNKEYIKEKKSGLLQKGFANDSNVKVDTNIGNNSYSAIAKKRSSPKKKPGVIPKRQNKNVSRSSSSSIGFETPKAKASDSFSSSKKHANISKSKNVEPGDKAQYKKKSNSILDTNELMKYQNHKSPVTTAPASVSTQVKDEPEPNEEVPQSIPEVDTGTESVEWLFRSVSPVSKMLIAATAKAANKSPEHILRQEMLSFKFGISKTTEKALTVRGWNEDLNKIDNEILLSDTDENENIKRLIKSQKNHKENIVDVFTRLAGKFLEIEKILAEITLDIEENNEVNSKKKLINLQSYFKANVPIQNYKNVLIDQQKQYTEKIEEYKAKTTKVSMKLKEKKEKNANLMLKIKLDTKELDKHEQILEQAKIGLEAENAALKDEKEKLQREYSKILNVQENLMTRFNEQKDELLKIKVSTSDEAALKEKLQNYEKEVSILKEKIRIRTVEYGYVENLLTTDENSLTIQTSKNDNQKALKLALDDLIIAQEENLVLKEKLEKLETLFSSETEDIDTSDDESEELNTTTNDEFETDYIFNELKKVMGKEKKLSLENKRLKKENAKWKKKIKFVV